MLEGVYSEELLIRHIGLEAEHNRLIIMLMEGGNK